MELGYFEPSKTSTRINPTFTLIPNVIPNTIPVETQFKNNTISTTVIAVSFCAGLVSLFVLAAVFFICKKRNKKDGNAIIIESMIENDFIQNHRCSSLTPFETISDKTAGNSNEDNEHKHVSTINTVQPLRFNQGAERITSWKPEFGAVNSEYFNNQEMKKYHNAVSSFRYKTETLSESTDDQKYYPAQDFDTDFYYSRNIMPKEVPIKYELETIDGFIN
jgi:hypothetical protein